MSGRLLLALDPAMLSPALGSQTSTPHSGTGFAAPPANELHRWDLALLCSPPAPLPRTNQSGGVPRLVPAAGSLHGDVGMATSSRAGWSQALEREVRSAESTAMPPLPAGCQQLVVSSDDDANNFDKALNWTTGAVHCSHAGLTAIPPLPANAQTLYALVFVSVLLADHF